MTASQKLPHHQLLVYQRALELLRAVRDARLADARLRGQAIRAAKSTCLNIAEGAGRWTKPDKRRAYVIARGEAGEAAAAVEVAVQCGEAPAEDLAPVERLAREVSAMLTAMMQ